MPVHFSRDPKPEAGSTTQIGHKDANSHPPVVDLSSTKLFKQFSQSKMKSTSLQLGLTAPKNPDPAKVESSKSRWQKPFKCRRKTAVSSSSINDTSINQLDALSHAFGVKPPSWKEHNPGNLKTSRINFSTSTFSAHTNITNPPLGLEPSMSMIQPELNFQSSFLDHTVYTSIFGSLKYANHPNGMEVPWIDSGHSQKHKIATDDNSSTSAVQAISSSERDEILTNFRLFKQFDTVEDYADHHYISNSAKHVSLDYAMQFL